MFDIQNLNILSEKFNQTVYCLWRKKIRKVFRKCWNRRAKSSKLFRRRKTKKNWQRKEIFAKLTKSNKKC